MVCQQGKEHAGFAVGSRALRASFSNLPRASLSCGGGYKIMPGGDKPFCPVAADKKASFSNAYCPAPCILSGESDYWSAGVQNPKSLSSDSDTHSLSDAHSAILSSGTSSSSNGYCANLGSRSANETGVQKPSMPSISGTSSFSNVNCANLGSRSDNWTGAQISSSGTSSFSNVNCANLGGRFDNWSAGVPVVGVQPSLSPYSTPPAAGCLDADVARVSFSNLPDTVGPVNMKTDISAALQRLVASCGGRPQTSTADDGTLATSCQHESSPAASSRSQRREITDTEQSGEAPPGHTEAVAALTFFPNVPSVRLGSISDSKQETGVQHPRVPARMETVKPSENSTSDDRRTEFQQPKNSTSDNRQAGAQQPRTPGRRESVNPFGNGTSDDRQTGVRPSPAAHVKASRVREGARHTLVLDLDETLLHSSFEPTTADFIVPITVDGQRHTVYARKRPFVDYFLRKAGELFSVIVWTASVRSYAEPLIDALLSSAGTSVQVERMYRTECTELYGEYAKDLTKCSGSLDTVCLVDNSPAAACLQVKNHIPISSWFSDGSDTALLRLLPFLERVSCSHSVYDVLEPAQAVLEVQAKQLAQSEPIDIDVDRL